MRARQISVEKLFGIFDHMIPLKMEERITVLHGLNGYGKTILLRMVDGLLNGTYEAFLTIPFERWDLTVKLEGPKREGPKAAARAA